MAKAKHITAFRSITNAGIDASWTGSAKVTMLLFQMLILRPSAQFSCCQLLITKLSTMIYISALYKPAIVSIDVITQLIQVGLYLLQHCLLKIVIFVDVTDLKNYISK